MLLYHSSLRKKNQNQTINYCERACFPGLVVFCRLHVHRRVREMHPKLYVFKAFMALRYYSQAQSCRYSNYGRFWFYIFLIGFTVRTFWVAWWGFFCVHIIYIEAQKVINEKFDIWRNFFTTVFILSVVLTIKKIFFLGWVLAWWLISRQAIIRFPQHLPQCN